MLHVKKTLYIQNFKLFSLIQQFAGDQPYYHVDILLLRQVN